MSLERSLCQALIKDDNGLLTLSKYKIKPNLFRAEKPLFDFIIRHYSAHNTMPNEEVIRRSVDKNFEAEDPGQPLSYWCSEIVARERVHIAHKASNEGVKLLESFDVDGWVQRLATAIFEINSDLGESTDVIVDSQERIDLVLSRYKERLESGGVAGIELPWEFLTTETGGMQSGDVNVISADTGVGKTWLLILIGLHAWMSGQKILLVSKEMSADMIEDRFHSLIGKIPYKLFRQGKLDEDTYKALEASVQSVCSGNNKRFVIVDDVQSTKSGMLDVEAKIREYNPNLLLVDGIYLISDDTGGEDFDWKSLARVVKALKRVLSKYGIPGVVTTQNKDLTNQQRKGKTGANNAANSTNALAYSKEISRIATLIMILYQSREDKAANKMCMFLPKVREGENLTVQFNWNFENMDFSMMDGSTLRNVFEVPEATGDGSDEIGSFDV